MSPLPTFLGPRRFVEAAIEITPFGVQLVTVYGKGAPSRSVSPSNAISTTSTRSYDRYNNRKDMQYNVRAFLPRQQILDVIVMEVVWPHCVWSQVVFRVMKGDIGDYLSKGESQGAVEGIVDGCENIQNNSNADQNTQNTRQKLQQGSQHTQTTSSFIQALQQQDQVSIVPAFPEECQGMLSYEQCLHIQSEIETLLGI